MTRAAEQCREYIEDKYPGVRIGRLACRDTAGGSISQHSAFDGYDSNALDIMGGVAGSTRAENIKLIQEIVDDLTLNLEAWSIRKILWKVADHYGHAHVDYYPMCLTHKWCGRAMTPEWELSDLSTFFSRDPDPENGEYHGEDDMKWSDIVADATWAKAWEDGFIEGDPAVMPDYYFADGPATEDEKKNGYNVIMQAQMEKTK